MKRRHLQGLSGGLLALLGSGCVEVLPAAVPQARFLGAESVDSEQAAGAFAGLDLEESFAGSLEDLRFLPGLEVYQVHTGSPAARAGLRAGDRIVSVDGSELSDLDQWAAILAAGSAGQGLALKVEREQALHDVALALADSSGGSLPAPTRWVERLRARAVFESQTVVLDEAHSVRPVLTETLPESPLDGELPIGARIFRLDGEEVTGAQQLARRLAEAEFGESIEIEYDTAQLGRRTVDLELWSPPRRVTRLRVPILFDWKSSADGEETSFHVIDLWLISLFGYERDGQTRAWSVLRWLRFESGTGELTEIESETDS